jgi:hypothetical protein
MASLKSQEDGSSLLEEPFFFAVEDSGTGGCLGILFENIGIFVCKTNNDGNVFHSWTVSAARVEFAEPKPTCTKGQVINLYPVVCCCVPQGVA